MDMHPDLIPALIKTGDFLEKYCLRQETCMPSWKESMDQAVVRAHLANPWFIEDFVMTSLHSIALILKEQELKSWAESYRTLIKEQRKMIRVGVISAGNIPLVGFHDFLCVLISGHTYLGKLSSQDNILLPLLAGFITELYPPLKERVHFVDNRLRDFDAVIATGSNNTARYFEYYFRNYPAILRKTRNSMAILSGDETDRELEQLGDDIFLYFGLGCRNVSKIFVPAGYDLTTLFPHWTRYAFLEHHNKYHNNYSYYKAIYLVNREEHLDNGFVLVKKDEHLVSPVSVIYVEEYNSLDLLTQKLDLVRDQIQCVVGRKDMYEQAIPFGNAQFPGISDYADGVDTLQFILNINEIN